MQSLFCYPAKDFPLSAHLILIKNYKRMLQPKYFIFILLLLYVFGCENLPDEVIENKSVNYKLIDFQALSTISQNTNSLFQFSVKFDNDEDVESIDFSIKDELDENLESGQLEIKESSPRQFVGEYTFDNDTITGDFVLRLVVNDVLGGTSEIIQHNFQVIGKVPNSIPLISNLVAPDSVIVQEPKSLILMSIEVSDSNGLSDVSKVYFTLTKPNGTSSGNKITMFDDGNKQQHNDDTAGDGKYSIIIEITSSADKGKFKFEFFAEDKSNALSNSIIHFIEIL